MKTKMLMSILLSFLVTSLVAAEIPAKIAIRTHLQGIMKRETGSKGCRDIVSRGGSLQRSKEGRI